MVFVQLGTSFVQPNISEQVPLGYLVRKEKGLLHRSMSDGSSSRE